MKKNRLVRSVIMSTMLAVLAIGLVGTCFADYAWDRDPDTGTYYVKSEVYGYYTVGEYDHFNTATFKAERFEDGYHWTTGDFWIHFYTSHLDPVPAGSWFSSDEVYYPAVDVHPATWLASEGGSSYTDGYNTWWQQCGAVLYPSG
ncbi:MAG: hypothetical protein IAX21_06610 [Candidatus Bathyarchaeota archaeon]|nr:MAG: hypothetical protein IAX21_06610 [Candidatus Bathyarchaeota archaeon]